MQKQARITSKGQITVPREVWRILGVRAGDYCLRAMERGMEILAVNIPTKVLFGRCCQSMLDREFPRHLDRVEHLQKQRRANGFRGFEPLDDSLPGDGKMTAVDQECILAMYHGAQRWPEVF